MWKSEEGVRVRTEQTGSESLRQSSHPTGPEEEEEAAERYDNRSTTSRFDPLKQTYGRVAKSDTAASSAKRKKKKNTKWKRKCGDRP